MSIRLLNISKLLHGAEDEDPTPRYLTFAILPGLVLVLFYANQFQQSAWGAIVATASLIALAALLVGTLIGLLFGIPRSLTVEARSPHSPIATPAASAGVRGQGEGAPAIAATDSTLGYSPNTNLEQISDWLTKILVGVGLASAHEIPDQIQRFAAYIRPGLGDTPAAGVFGIALTVFFLIGGFLVGYMWARLRLGRAFSRADRGALFRELTRVAQRGVTTAAATIPAPPAPADNAAALDEPTDVTARLFADFAQLAEASPSSAVMRAYSAVHRALSRKVRHAGIHDLPADPDLLIDAAVESGAINETIGAALLELLELYDYVKDGQRVIIDRADAISYVALCGRMISTINTWNPPGS